MRLAPRVRQRQPLGDGDLRLHEVDAEDLLGDGVLDLEPGVHLEEEELLGRRVHEELDGAGAAVVDRVRRAAGGLVERPPGLLAQAGGRRLLDDLLVAALQGAVPLAEHDDALGGADDLHLDVAAALEEALDEDGGVAEGRGGLVGGQLHGRLEVVELAHDAHPATATTGRRLDDHRQVGGRHGGGLEPVELRHARVEHELLGPDLVAHGLDGRGRRPDPRQARLDDGAGEVGVLRQEAVARVHGVRARRPRGLEHEVGPQVGLGGRAPREAYGAVRLRHERQVRVGVGVHGDGLDAEAAARGHDAAGDLAAVGDQNGSDHRCVTS
ncbi:hypothetical protein QE405_003229 [Nocardioides zeae]|uniref:Uncharacterized protein n=1 Tax=Nocardioides zeae TaxID=1457234 RepID=A0AAJ1U4V5_9ACTN|nr:hypothetical protein [Nocardioides zeae]